MCILLGNNDTHMRVNFNGRHVFSRDLPRDICQAISLKGNEHSSEGRFFSPECDNGIHYVIEDVYALSRIVYIIIEHTTGAV